MSWILLPSIGFPQKQKPWRNLRAIISLGGNPRRHGMFAEREKPVKIMLIIHSVNCNLSKDPNHKLNCCHSLWVDFCMIFFIIVSCKIKKDLFWCQHGMGVNTVDGNSSLETEGTDFRTQKSWGELSDVTGYEMLRKQNWNLHCFFPLHS